MYTGTSHIEQVRMAIFIVQSYLVHLMSDIDKITQSEEMSKYQLVGDMIDLYQEEF